MEKMKEKKRKMQTDEEKHIILNENLQHNGGFTSCSMSDYGPKNMKIGIVGGGLGGLSAALALQRTGRFCNIHIYERDDHFGQRKEGYGLTLTYNPSGPLAKLGILEDLALLDVPSRSHFVFSPEGHVRGYYGNAFKHIPQRRTEADQGFHRSFSQRKGMGQRRNLRVPRQQVRKVMIEKLCPDHVTIHWSKRLLNFFDTAVSSKTTRNKQMNDSQENFDKSDGGVLLYFEDGTSDVVDLLVGADGVRSKVASLVYTPRDVNCRDLDSTYVGQQHHISNSNSNLSSCCEKQEEAQYIGIFIILGITSDFRHPFLDEKGFYTLDGIHRLFTMPFSGSLVDDIMSSNIEGGNNKIGRQHGLPSTNVSHLPPRQIMWQLSFRLDDHDTVDRLKQASSQKLLDEVLQRCRGWHEPVEDMFRNTPLESIWGTGLMDRIDAASIDRPLQRKGVHRRVVLLGDAVHAMSPFKGQGANQALEDGPLLAKWLVQSKFHSALVGFDRDVRQRTHKTVKASREAALRLHSPTVLQNGEEDFVGIPRERIPYLLEELKQRNIGANLSETLEDAIAEVIIDLNIGSTIVEQNRKYLILSKEIEEHLLEAAATGNLPFLRQASKKYDPQCFSSVSNQNGDTCLHLAAKHEHYAVCQWLLSECNVSLDLKNHAGFNPFDTALRESSDKTEKSHAVLTLLERYKEHIINEKKTSVVKY